MTEPQAIRDWHTRAIVRILETTTKCSFDGEHTFQSGEIVTMVQWGRAGRTVDRDAWWSSYDIDGAFIIEASNVEVIKVLDEVTPFDQEESEQEPTLVRCSYCGQMHESHLVESCPLKP